MDREQLVRLASDAATTAKDLYAIVGRDREVDRLIAVHPHATTPARGEEAHGGEGTPHGRTR